MEPPERILICRVNEKEGYLQYIPTVTEAPTTPLSIVDLSSPTSSHLLVSHVICLKDEHDSQSSLQMVPLPDTQPTRPEEWSDTEWKNRVVIGNDKFHLFIKFEDYPGPNGFIIKVAASQDSSGRWFYEDIGDGPEGPADDRLLSEEMRLFLKTARQIWDRIPDTLNWLT